VTFRPNDPQVRDFELVRHVLFLGVKVDGRCTMPIKITSPRIVIECSEPEESTFIREESDIVAEVEAFRSEIAKWAADRARRQALDAKNASEDLRRWSREYFGSVENRSSTVRRDVGQTAVAERAA
jgi:hypothetical protein